MTLHFSLKDIFGLCVVLMIWNLVMPAGTIWTAAAYFGAVLAYFGSLALEGFSSRWFFDRGGQSARRLRISVRCRRICGGRHSGSGVSVQPVVCARVVGKRAAV